MKKVETAFIITGSIMTILFLILVNFLTSHQYPWFIYPSLALLLVISALFCFPKKKYTLFSILSSILLLMYLIVENYIDTPDYPWVLYAVAPIVMYPILVMLGKYTKTMTVAILGSMVIIFYYLWLNVSLSPQYPWVIYPAFAVLWWPLSVFYVKKKAYFSYSISATLLISIFFITQNAISSPHVIWAVYPIFGVLWWPLSMYFFVYKPKRLRNKFIS